ncbi:hypothetical protein C8R45DRAFT_927597 [Mycena sanguinolenta]|nr:hypothetical protein C8R45DRAFT_927597 [Mycena sanguinolenta]
MSEGDHRGRSLLPAAVSMKRKRYAYSQLIEVHVLVHMCTFVGIWPRNGVDQVAAQLASKTKRMKPNFPHAVVGVEPRSFFTMWDEHNRLMTEGDHRGQRRLVLSHMSGTQPSWNEGTTKGKARRKPRRERGSDEMPRGAVECRNLDGRWNRSHRLGAGECDAVRDRDNSSTSGAHQRYGTDERTAPPPAQRHHTAPQGNVLRRRSTRQKVTSTSASRVRPKRLQHIPNQERCASAWADQDQGQPNEPRDHDVRIHPAHQGQTSRREQSTRAQLDIGCVAIREQSESDCGG